MNEAEIINYKVFSLIFFVVVFAIAVFYAIRPKNKKKFENAAKLPLEDE